MNHFGVKCITSIALLICSITANSTPTTWAFEGVTNTGVFSPCDSSQPVCQAVANAPFSGSLTFDSEAVNTQPTDGFGFYTSSGGPYGLRIDIGDYSYQTDYVTFDIRTDPVPLFLIYLYDQPGQWFRWISIVTCGNDILSSAQMLSPPASFGGCSAYDASELRLSSFGGIGLGFSRVWLVPEPATLALAGAALAGGVVTRRRKQTLLNG